MNEQHLVLREKFPLAKSTAFNIAFALCLVISLFAFRGELEHTLFGNPITYVAAVAGATPEGESIKNISNTSKKESTSETTTLPFSDDVQIATGTDMNSVTITPVFPNAQGDAVQYVIMNGQEYEPTNTGE